ncbi:MAG: hypothetical protein L0Y36_09645 [Planctomycetales bacterium]|nr:hypothetical protein [Planctomycetales bacterium]
MKKGSWFLSVFTILCLDMGFLWAAPAVETDGPKGVLLLPDNISVELVSPQRGTLMLTGKDGGIELPQGQYRLESWTLEKKDEQGQAWRLSGDLTTARMVEIGPDPAQPEIKPEPIHCNLQVSPSHDSMDFTLGLTGPSGERLRVDAPGVKSDQLPTPTFVLYNEDKSYQKSYDFQSQCCGNYRFSWTPPVGAAGPFQVDLKVAGPFAIDFEPRNLTELTEETIAQMQKAAEEAAARRRTEIRKIIRTAIWIVAAYVCIITVAVFGLLKFRKRIAATSWGRTKFSTRWLILALGAFLLLALDPLLQLVRGNCELMDTVFQSGSFLVLLLAGALLVWAVRKAPTKWPFVTIFLYGVLFVLFLIPVLFMVFCAMGRPDTGLSNVDLSNWTDFYGTLFTAPGAEVWLIWLIIAALLIVQASLLIIPVRITHGRPKPRRGIWWTATMAGLLYTALLFFAGLSILAAGWGDSFLDDHLPRAMFWILVYILPVNWAAWLVAFGLFSRSMEPDSFIRRLMQWLIRGSILELLVAVPSHIIVRHRDVCCAHGVTAAGISAGLAVMFFAFGPGLYFLYADRIRRRKPNLPDTPDPHGTEPVPSNN